jgi:hypothetical protein
VTGPRLRVGRSWAAAGGLCTVAEHGLEEPKGRLVAMAETVALAEEIVTAVNTARDGALARIAEQAVGIANMWTASPRTRASIDASHPGLAWRLASLVELAAAPVDLAEGRRQTVPEVDTGRDAETPGVPFPLVVAAVKAGALREAADSLLATDVHEDLCNYGAPGTCDCALGEHVRWLQIRAHDIEAHAEAAQDGPAFEDTQ